MTLDQIANGRPWCIAGGWAACPQLANDQDVWIFVTNPSDGTLRRHETLEDVKDEILSLIPSIEEDNTSTVDAESYDKLGVEILRVGKLGDRHIMVTDAQDVVMLLDCFDVSTHQCAIDQEMQFVRGGGWTPITVLPKPLRDTPNTMARLEKIRARYAHLVPTKRRIIEGDELIPFYEEELARLRAA